MNSAIGVSLPESVFETELLTAVASAFRLACNTVMKDDLCTIERPERWVVKFTVEPDLSWHESVQIGASSRKVLLSGTHYSETAGSFSLKEASSIVQIHCWDKVVRVIVAALIVMAGEEKISLHGKNKLEELELTVSVWPVVNNAFPRTAKRKVVQRHAHVHLLQYGIKVAPA